MKKKAGIIFAVLIFLIFAAGSLPLYGSDETTGHGHLHSVGSEQEFLVEMIPHHQEAVDSAREILAKSTRKEMKNLAKNIVEAQEREISLMKQWLLQWYPGHDASPSYQPMMRSLKNLSSNEADIVFLEDMIEHHRAALDMAQEVLDKGLAVHDEILALAGEIISTQTQEIDRMEQWLGKWKSGPTTPSKSRHGH